LPDEAQQLRLEAKIRSIEWVRGDITPGMRAELHGHPASMVMLTGEAGVGKHAIARALERHLVDTGHHAYLLDGKNVFLGVDADLPLDDRAGLVRRFGEVAHLFLDAGTLVVSTTNVVGLADHAAVHALVSPFKMFVVHVGANGKGMPEGADLRIDPNTEAQDAVAAIVAELSKRARLRAN
jgi:adenylylsulfate kinase-like enzyme